MKAGSRSARAASSAAGVKLGIRWCLFQELDCGTTNPMRTRARRSIAIMNVIRMPFQQFTAPGNARAQAV
jgi:hypothetical protein